VSLAPPEPVSSNPLRRLAADLNAERRGRVATWPPGDNRLDPRRTYRITTDALGVLLDAYERHGPIFSLRLLTSRNVFMIGPEANHHILVSHPQDFRWRDGGFGELIPLLGDGLLTIDGDYHRRSRRIMLPAFHSERIRAAHATMVAEADAAVGRLEDGDRIDVYAWSRRLALRVAMKALFGFEADDETAARGFEQALGFYGYDFTVQALRGPRTPWARMLAARRRLDVLVHGEIARRRRTGERGEDVLSLLLDAGDEDGTTLSDRQVRDQVMTLLFAGHDTTTATLAFLAYELARHPHERAALLAEEDALGAATPDQLLAGSRRRLEMALDETLRLYPPAWIGPRRAVRTFEFAGYTVPADMPVNYCSYVSHRLAKVFPDPHAFRPERMAPEAKAALPRGAYVPFGAGSRICLGMRFGQLEIRTIASRLLRDFVLDLEPGFALEIRQTPTLGPRRGLPVVVRAR
jgi:cytochrome P450